MGAVGSTESKLIPARLSEEADFAGTRHPERIFWPLRARGPRSFPARRSIRAALPTCDPYGASDGNRQCSEVRGYSYKRSHLVALRPTKISVSDPPSMWWPGE